MPLKYRKKRVLRRVKPIPTLVLPSRLHSIAQQYRKRHNGGRPNLVAAKRKRRRVHTKKSFSKSSSKKSNSSVEENENVKQRIYTLMLRKAKQALDSIHVPFFLSSGTCLGYFRNRKFIDYDYDIDLGIMKQHYNANIIKALQSKGFRHYRTLGSLQTGLEHSFYLIKTALGKQAKLDIFVHYCNRVNPKTKKQGIWWHSYAYPRFKRKISYCVDAFTTKMVMFKGLKVAVPYPTLKYIKQHYGSDWRIPKRPFTQYKYATSPKSIVR